MKRESSIFFNLPLKLIFYTGIVGIAMFIVTGYFLDNEYRLRTEERINSTASTLDWAIDPLLENKNYGALKRFVERVKVNPFIEKIRVYDNRGKVIASDESGETGKVINEKLIDKVIREEKLLYKNRNFNADIFEVVLPVKGYGFSSGRSDKLNGILYMKFNLKRERRIYLNIKYFIIISIVAFLTLLLILTMSILKHEVLNPLAKVKDGLKKVSNGDYSFKIVHKGKKEINEIISFFNRMSEKVKVSSEVFQENTKEAERISLVKSIFLANMTHELRTPLNLIIGYTELLVEEEKNENKRKKMNTIVSAGKHLLVIINDVLDLSKMDVDKLKLTPKSFSFYKMLGNIKNIFSMRPSKEKVEFRINFVNKIPEYLFGDESRIKQIIINLLSNSFKFTESGYVELKFRYRKSYLEIVVKDTGIGIPSDNLEKIFNSFEQVEMNHNRKYEGTGLGLSITKELSMLMDGDIHVKSQKGSGSEFIVKLKLPVADEPEKNFAIEEAKEEIEGDGTRLDVLLAEDIEDNRILVKHMLRKLKEVHIDFAENGKVALDKLDKKNYDVLLLDIQMPVMNGMDVLKHMKENDKLKNIHIIATTAYAMKEEKENILDAGSNDIITKPINMTELREKICELLEKKRERRYEA